jgi:hypothetical protein
MRSKRRSLCIALALGAVLALGSSAQADIVQFVTTGVFTGGSNTTSGTNVYTDAANGILITFNASLNNSVQAPPASAAAFGSFNTTGTVGSIPPGTLGGTFTLNIFQTAPTAGTVSYAGAASGALVQNASQASIQFSPPFIKTIGIVSYAIVTADDLTLGKLNLSPPSVNNGLTTLTGAINAIPEPSSLVLSALLAPALLALVARTRRSIHNRQN